MAKALDDQGAKIQSELDEAARLRAEAEAMLAQIRLEKAEAEAQAADMLATAEADARRLEAEAKAKLEETLARRQALAERRIAQAEAQATIEVKAVAADLAAKAAQDILTARLAAAKPRRRRRGLLHCGGAPWLVGGRAVDEAGGAFLAGLQSGEDVAHDPAEDHVGDQHPAEGAEACAAGEGARVAHHGDDQHHRHPGRHSEQDALGLRGVGGQLGIDDREQRPHDQRTDDEVDRPPRHQVVAQPEHAGDDFGERVEDLGEQEIHRLKNGNRDGRNEAGGDPLFYA
uniref:ATP synthase F0 subunit B n=1 Tax=Parastrongyloides trichosuri TaxID=131310 RepID=A0A0N4ZVR2_PARTI